MSFGRGCSPLLSSTRRRFVSNSWRSSLSALASSFSSEKSSFPASPSWEEQRREPLEWLGGELLLALVSPPGSPQVPGGVERVDKSQNGLGVVTS